MNENDFDRTARLWLDEGPSQLSDRVLHAALDEIHVTRQRRSWWPARRWSSMNSIAKLAIAAAAVAVVAVAGFSLIPRDGLGGPLATPSTSPSPSATPRPISFDLHGPGALEPGRYHLDYHPPIHITFTVPAGWEKLSVPTTVWGPESATRLGFMTVDNVFIDPCQTGLDVREPPVGPTVDDLAAALGEVPGLEATTPIDVTLSGIAGKRIDLTAVGPWTDCQDGGSTLVRANEGQIELPAPEPNEDSRWWILDVDGHRLVIIQSARQEASAADRAALQSIVDSIQIEDLSDPSATASPAS